MSDSERDESTSDPSTSSEEEEEEESRITDTGEDDAHSSDFEEKEEREIAIESDLQPNKIQFRFWDQFVALIIKSFTNQVGIPYPSTYRFPGQEKFF